MAKKKRKIKNKKKRILVISDPHVGATTGLIPLDCAYAKPFHKERRMELATRFWDTVKQLQPIDHIISVGDVIHGIPSKTATDEILINEEENQKEEAIAVFEQIGAPTGLLIHGTPHHVGESSYPIEQSIADAMGYEFNKTAEEHEINGVLFHVKHKISGSNDPRTLGNALAKDYEAVLHNHERYGVPSRMPHVLLRGHRHVYHQRGDEKWLGFILPCLQAWGGNYSVQLTATYYPTVGIVWFDIDRDGGLEWRTLTWKLKTHQEN